MSSAAANGKPKASGSGPAAGASKGKGAGGKAGKKSDREAATEETAVPREKTLYERHDELIAAAETEEQKLADLKKEQSLALKVAAKTKNARAIELAKKWDLQGTGSITKIDFRTNVRNLGLKAEDDEIDALFARMDDDGGGSLDLVELRTALQKLQDEASVAAEEATKIATIATRLRKKADFSTQACKARAPLRALRPPQLPRLMHVPQD
eukprot:5008352-Prymnesium_polylepis.1